MTEEEIRTKIKQVSATIGMDTEDRELTEDEQDALLQYIYGNISKKELEEKFGSKLK